MKHRCLVALVCGILSFPVAAQDAPFGLSWGPVDRIPEPWRVHREGNITSLFYEHNQPIAAGADTEQVIIDVCKVEGLQQVTWVSRRLTSEEARIKFRAMHKQGLERYGEASPFSMPNSEYWNGERVVIGLSKEFEGRVRLVMFMRGDQYWRCSGIHERETGHRVDMHVLELLRKGY